MSSRRNKSDSSAVEATIVVPAYKEAGNLEPLTERLFAAFKKADINAEVIVVDDNSQDGSEEKVNALQKKGYNVRIIVRTTERGLSSAVLRGFDEAKSDKLICMDADLQHPPEYIPQLVKALDRKAFVLGTRYGEGTVVDKNWPLYRRVLSGGARMLARPLTPLTDPMSGLFGITADSLKKNRKHVSPLGFKIGLELYVKCGITSHDEVPFNFGTRTVGHSKLSGGVMVQYLVHLKQLYMFKHPILIPILIILFLYIAFTVLFA